MMDSMNDRVEFSISDDLFDQTDTDGSKGCQTMI